MREIKFRIWDKERNSERPLIFSTSSIRDILWGRKIQTRRVIKTAGPDWTPITGEEWMAPTDNRPALGGYPKQCALFRRPGLGGVGLPYPYRSGDRLWVKEVWQVDAPRDGMWCDTVFYGDKRSPLSWIPEKYRTPEYCLYRFGWDNQAHPLKWRSPIHMPRWASRINLEVTDVRAERLQEISDEDCQAEGFSGLSDIGWRYCFGQRWNEHNQKRGFGWAVNPWVWVIGFRLELFDWKDRLDKEGRNE